jgi:two-component system copper resistance phosphate regulon response regulator CusR/two-component system response regulator QseB
MGIGLSSCLAGYGVSVNHILVVDDDAALGRLTKLVLSTAGHEVDSFVSPIAAMEALADAANYPSMIVLDLNMPEMDGREFYRRARSTGFHNPIIILSAYGAFAAQKELGADAALAKPFDPFSLLSLVKTLLNTPD